MKFYKRITDIYQDWDTDEISFDFEDETYYFKDLKRIKSDFYHYVIDHRGKKYYVKVLENFDVDLYK